MQVIKRQHPWTLHTGIDSTLCERANLHPFHVTQLRKAFWRGYRKLPRLNKQNLAEGGILPRFIFQVLIFRPYPDLWTRWLKHLQHSDRDVDEMCRGEYPISPYVIRLFSALFGIDKDFLLLGSVPSVDRAGANIDAWPMMEKQGTNSKAGRWM